MTDVIRIPMADTIFDELDDAFVENEKESSHDFVWKLIRGLCRDAKLGKLNKTCTVNLIEDGQTKQEQVKLKGYELPIAQSNSDWVPENLDKGDIKYFEHKITDKTREYLNLFCSFAILRHQKYCESMKVDHEKKVGDLIDKKTSVDTIDKIKENFEKTIEKFNKAEPKYIEEILTNAVYPQIHQQIVKNIDMEFDKENEEMYPKEDKKKSSK